MASSSGNNQSSYMDGVYVKISENYKPPKRISMVMSYSQRLALNKLIQEPILNYDFSKEESIKSKIFEWKKARVAILEQRKQRLTKLNNEESLETSETEVKQNETKTETNEESNDDKSSSTDPYYQKETGILLPKIIKSNDNLLMPIPFGNVVNKNYVKTQINYSEFETDTSSPFDNMELKILNNFEELAQVLKTETNPDSFLKDFTKPPSDNIYQKLINNFSNDNKNGYYNYTQNNLQTMQITSNDRLESTDSTNLSLRSVKEIMKSLQDDLEATQITNQEDIKSNATCSAAISNVSKDDLDNPYNNLNNELQNMALTISSMGFPLPRVARACQLFEGNEKKIVEHLLAMSELLDLGFPEEKVASALLKCENDRDKALDMLIT